jgi:phosphomannomutase
LGREVKVEDYVESYLADTVDHLDLEAIRKADFRVVVDLSNGTGGTVIEAFLDRLGCRSILINDGLSGDFAHDPTPRPKNMVQLSSLLKHLEADVGFALNTDVDSVGVVTEKGEPLSEECTLPLVADHLLRGRGGVVVTNLSTSMMIERVVEQHKGKLIRTKIGEGNVVFLAKNENALIAGEGSGGVAYMPLARAFDGFLSMAFILESMATQGMKVSQLREKLPVFHMRKGAINAPSDRIYYGLDETRRQYQHEEVDLTDGVRVQWPGMWLHVRASNTEPILRVFVEGEEKKKVDSLFSDTILRMNSVVHGKS